jgi:subtilase family serine protease
MNQTNEEGTNEVTQTSEREKGGEGRCADINHMQSVIYTVIIYMT